MKVIFTNFLDKLFFHVFIISDDQNAFPLRFYSSVGFLNESVNFLPIGFRREMNAFVASRDPDILKKLLDEAAKAKLRLDTMNLGAVGFKNYIGSSEKER